MRRFSLSFVVLALIVVCQTSLLPQNVITLKDLDRRVSVASYAEYYRDKTGKMTFHDIRSLSDTSWQTPGKASLNFGYSSDTVWIRFQVSNQSNVKEWVLESVYPSLDSITVFKPTKDLYITSEAGRHLPFSHREVEDKNFLFRLTPDNEQQNIIYIRIRSQSSLNCELILWQPPELAKTSDHERFFDGMVYGLFLIMVLYNFSIFLSIHDRNYLFSSLYQCFGGLFFFSYQGYSAQYLFPDLPSVATHSTPVFLSLTWLFATQFGLRFLNLKQQFPIGRSILISAVLVLIIPFASPIVGYSVAVRTITMLALVMTAMLLTSSIVCLLKGYRPARFFLIAWTGFLLTSMATFLARSGAIPTSFVTEHGVQIGGALEALLLSLALGDRIQMDQKRSFDEQVALRKSYARFVPEQFMRLLNKAKITEVDLGNAVQREMTVLFTDIRSFTTISETMTPEDNFRFLNAMLRQTGPLIREHNGFIDKYIGDAIMALFDREPEDALRAAIAMRKALGLFNVRRKEKGFEPIKIGIGINTGNLILGTIGEPERMEGTVISDAVNLASRMEGLTKFYDATILISDRTFSKIADPSKYNFRVLDKVSVKGKKESVSVIEILDGDSDEMLALKVSTKPEFERGIYSYLNQEFTVALVHFKTVLDQNSTDRAAQLYCERAGYYAEHGVPPGWDAVETFTEK